MAGQAVTLRTMIPDDIAAGLRLCRAAHWNQVARDWELFLALGPRGCRVAVKEDRVVGTVTTVRYKNYLDQADQSALFAWIGMVLVEPEERGCGIGTRLLEEALEMLSDVESVKLDATPAGQPVYRKLGFVDEYALSRMERAAGNAPRRMEGSDVRPMTRDDLPQVCQIDREVFGADRRAVLEWMLEGAPEYAFVVSSAGRVEGYGFGRHGFRFEHLGPIVASSEEAARQIVLNSLGDHPDRTFILDATLEAASWRAWLEEIGFGEQRPFMRMFYGRNSSPGRPQNQFAILGPEFG